LEKLSITESAVRAKDVERRAGGDVRVPQPCAVRGAPEAARVGDGSHRCELLDRGDHSAGTVVRVLDADQRGERGMRRARSQCSLDVDGRRHGTTIGGKHRAHLHPGERRGACHLPVDDVGPGVEQHLRTRRRMHPHGGLIRHRAAGEEQAPLLAEERGHLRLEAANRGIAVEDVVADFCFRHRSAHGGGRAGDGVGAEIDDGRGTVHGQNVRQFLGSRLDGRPRDAKMSRGRP
jgi:hypothetical protein